MDELEKLWAALKAKFSDEEEIPAPPPGFVNQPRVYKPKPFGAEDNSSLSYMEHESGEITPTKKYRSKAEADADVSWEGNKAYDTPAPAPALKPTAPPKVNRFEAAMIKPPPGPAAEVVPPVGIGERDVSLVGEEAPGIGLELTKDRSQSLAEKEVPENTSDHPQAQVSNKNLAAAQNLFIGAVDKNDVAKAVQKERAPKDRSGYYAALKQIADSSYRMMGQSAPTEDYYTAKMAQEQGAVKDYRSQLALALKQKFDAEQSGLDRASREGIASAGVAAANERARAAEAGREGRATAGREASDERARLGREATNQRAKEHNDMMRDVLGEKQAGKFEEDAPSADIVERTNEVERILSSGKPLPGFGRVQNTLRNLPGLAGQAFDAAIQAGMSPEEQETFRQTYGAGLDMLREAAGKQLTQDEYRKELTKLGQAAGQGEEATRAALLEIVRKIRARAQRKFKALSPEAKAKIMERGVGEGMLDIENDPDWERIE